MRSDTRSKSYKTLSSLPNIWLYGITSTMDSVFGQASIFRADRLRHQHLRDVTG